METHFKSQNSPVSHDDWEFWEVKSPSLKVAKSGDLEPERVLEWVPELPKGESLFLLGGSFVSRIVSLILIQAEVDCSTLNRGEAMLNNPSPHVPSTRPPDFWNSLDPRCESTVGENNPRRRFWLDSNKNIAMAQILWLKERSTTKHHKKTL